MVNLLPNLIDGETISTVMPLPEDEESWGELTVMFATANGYVRRNALSDFTDIRANGKIAMKFEGEDADDRLIAVATCTDADDVLLATRRTVRTSKANDGKQRFFGKAIRFQVRYEQKPSGESQNEEADDHEPESAISLEPEGLETPARSASRGVRIFTGRSSVGVRGIRLLGDDRVISMSILRHEENTPDVRGVYL